MALVFLIFLFLRCSIVRLDVPERFPYRKPQLEISKHSRSKGRIYHHTTVVLQGSFFPSISVSIVNNCLTRLEPSLF